MNTTHKTIKSTTDLSSPSTAPGRILIVDDEPRMTASLQALLESDGHEAVTANSGQDAIDKLKSGSFDIVLADVRMPEIDGIDVLRASRDLEPDRPVVLMTAYASLETAVAALNDGAYDYLMKPIDLTEMRLTVRRAVEKRRLDQLRDNLVNELRDKNITLARRVVELNALHEVGAALSTSGELNDLLKAILNLATGVIGSNYGSIMLLNEAGDALTVAATSGMPTGTDVKTHIPIEDTIAGQVVQTGDPLIIEDVENDPRLARRNRPQFETRSLICAPLKTPNAIVGVINLSDKRDHSPFSLDDLRLLVTLAAQAAMAIEDAQHYQQVSRQLSEITALYDLSTRLSNVERIDEMVGTVFDTLGQLTRCDQIQWWEWSSASGEVVLRGDTKAMSLNRPVCTTHVALDLAAFNDDVQSSQTIVHALLATGDYPQRLSAMTVPVRSAESPLGMFVLLRHRQTPCSEHERHLAGIVGSQAERIFERQRTLLNASRLVTMGKMISEIAHDLRKPLTNIRGSLQVLGSRLGEENNFGTILKDTDKEIVRLATLVTELVDFSNPKRYRTERRDLAPALKRAASLVERTAKKNDITLTTEIPGQLPPIFCDENQIIEGILNILMNAIEAMPGGGKLDITAEVCAAQNGDDKTLLILISDTGPGMNQNELARIFERYYTTKSSGTGLGLPIVQRIINSHEGTIRAESEPGAGTTFRVELPIR